MNTKPIGQYLVADKHLSPSLLDKALQIQASKDGARNKPRIGIILFQIGAITPEDLAVELLKQKRDRVRSSN